MDVLNHPLITQRQNLCHISFLADLLFFPFKFKYEERLGWECRLLLSLESNVRSVRMWKLWQGDCILISSFHIGTGVLVHRGCPCLSTIDSGWPGSYFSKFGNLTGRIKRRKKTKTRNPECTNELESKCYFVLMLRKKTGSFTWVWISLVPITYKCRPAGVHIVLFPFSLCFTAITANFTS